MKLSTDSDNINPKNLTTKVKTRNCSNTILKFQYLSSYQIKTMVFCWTAIHSAVSEILMTIHNWAKYSNYTTKRV